MVVDKYVLACPDFEAASNAVESGRPVELFVDASDFGWCAILTQRDRRGGPPKIVAVKIRSSSGAQAKSIVFERECYGLSKGAQRVESYVKALTYFVHTDHQNNTCARASKLSKRIRKQTNEFSVSNSRRPTCKNLEERRKHDHSGFPVVAGNPLWSG